MLPCNPVNVMLLNLNWIRTQIFISSEWRISQRKYSNIDDDHSGRNILKKV